jgi:predicted AlkP superfamily phosphohydrolase/phosphomutase
VLGTDSDADRPGSRGGTSLSRPLRKLALIGIDAGDLRFITASLDRLPNLRRLFERGRLQPLETTSTLLTGSVWPTFYTGSLPGAHGIYHHLQWDANRMSLRRVSPEWLPCEPFWYGLARQGVRVTAIDVPMAMPARCAGVVEVMNWGSHDQLGRFHCSGSPLARQIRRRFGAHPMGLEIPVDKTIEQRRSIRDRLVAGARIKGELVRWLLAATEWDLLVAVFGECHRGGHVLWPDGASPSTVPPDALLDVYRAVDTAVGAVIDDLGSVRAVVFALHGMQENLSQEHFAPPIVDAVNTLWRGGAIAPAASPGRPGLMRRLRQSVPAKVQNAIAHAVPTAVRDWVVSRATTGGYDWPTTPAVALLADYNGYVRLNVAHREAAGCLDPARAEPHRYLDLLRACLEEVRLEGSGRPLVKDVVDLARVYPGPRSGQLPDVVVTWERGSPEDRMHSPRLGAMGGRRDTGRSGNHRHEGFVVVPPELDPAPAPTHIVGLASWVSGCVGRPAMPG